MQKIMRTITDKVLLVYSTLAALALAVLIVAAFVQVCGRYIFNASPSWTEEMSRYAFVWCSCLGTAIALDKGAHASITVFEERLPHLPRKILQAVIYLVVLAISVLLIVTGYQLAAATINTPSPAMKIPMAYINIAISFCGFGMALSSVNSLLALPGVTYEKKEETAQ